METSDHLSVSLRRERSASQRTQADELLARIRTRQLLLATRIAELGSLRTAAAELSMTEPAASRLIKELEHTVGAPLFERHRRGMRPNAYGDAVIRRARIALTALAHAGQEVNALRAGALGHIRIGAVSGAIPFVIARTLVLLTRERPSLRVTVDVETSDRLVPALERGELDLLLARPLELSAHPDFAYEQLLEEPLTVVARRGHPLAGARKPLTLSAIVGSEWILFPQRSPMRAALTRLFREQTTGEPAIVIETASIVLTAALLEQTDRLAVLPSDVARYYSERNILAVVPLRLPPVMPSYGIITRRDRPLPPGAVIFLEVLRSASRELESSGPKAVRDLPKRTVAPSGAGHGRARERGARPTGAFAPRIQL